MNVTPPAVLARVADHIDVAGIELLPAHLLTDLVAAARAAGASEVVVGVLVDPTEPAVARERAFVKVASRIIGNGGSPTAPVTDGTHTVVLAA